MVGHHGADAEILIALAKLIHRRALVGIVHEVDVALQDLRIKLQRILDQDAIFGVIFIAHHVHEGAVVHAMHAQRAHKIAFHQPERFGQQQRVRGFHRHAIDHLAPEFLRHERIEFGFGHGRVQRAMGSRRRCPARGTTAAGNAFWPASWPRQSG